MSRQDNDPALHTVVDHLGQGIAMFDRDHRLVLSNNLFQQLLELPDDLVRPASTLDDIIRFLVVRGDFGDGDHEALVGARLAQIDNKNVSLTERPGHKGQYFEVRTDHLPEGGMVISYSDISSRIDAERELAKVNQSLEARVKDRTQELTALNSELERARAKADAANLGKTRFLAAASHDLLQPLNAARLYTSTMIERAHGSDLARLAQNIDASLGAVEDIMSALLDISRIDSGALKPSNSTFSIQELLRKVRVEFEPAAAEKNIKLRLVGADSAVHTDRRLVARVVQNLVSNAIKYTPEGGSVLVGCRKRGNRIRLDIIDSGIGIDKGQQSLIFNEFSRLEPGARIASGLGLGLSIVQRICSALNLQLEVESTVGKGSRFSIYARETTKAAEPYKEPEHFARTLNSEQFSALQILCVDNEIDILDAMNALLSGWGCNVRTAKSLKAISQSSMLEGWIPDIVLMDYHLDQTSGLDAIQWLRQTIGGHLPAVLITADRTPQVRELAAERDISVLPKPVKPAALRALIGRLT
ncbi:hybrid sensor histidine kinase/response regulator [Maritalea sp.]|uniref:hybrid sensor histidine kinase/response regulator n=1 Tax=Maritalea sp. TaxID=2003361 RepID=UPI003EF3010C